MARHPDATGEPISLQEPWLTGKPIMSVDDVGGNPSDAQINQILSALPPTRLFSIFTRFALVPKQPQLQAYTILRDLYLPRIDRVASLMFEEKQRFSKEWNVQMQEAKEN